MHKLYAALAFLVVLFAGLSSCVTSPSEMDRQDRQTLYQLLAQGQSEALFKLSSQPFAVDQEIVVIADDIRLFWQAMCGAGLKLAAANANAPETASTPVNAESYQQFADSQDMKMFFAKYLDTKARMLELSTEDGKKLRAIVRNDQGRTIVYGLKGPY